MGTSTQEEDKKKRYKIINFMKIEYQTLKNEVNQLKNIQVALLVGTLSASALLFTLIFSRIDAVNEETTKLNEILISIKTYNIEGLLTNFSEQLNNISLNNGFVDKIIHNTSISQINDTLINLSLQMQTCLQISNNKPIELFVLLPLAIILPSIIIFFHNFELINKKLAYCSNLESYILDNKKIYNYKGYENYRDQYYINKVKIIPLSKSLLDDDKKESSQLLKYLQSILYFKKNFRFEITALFTYIGLIIIDYFILFYNRLDEDAFLPLISENFGFAIISFVAVFILFIIGIGIAFEKESKFWFNTYILTPAVIILILFFLIINPLKNDIYLIIYPITLGIYCISIFIVFLITFMITIYRIIDLIKIIRPDSTYDTPRLDKIMNKISNKNLRYVSLIFTILIIFGINSLIILANYSITGLILYISITISSAVIFWAFLKIWNLKEGSESNTKIKEKWYEIIGKDNPEPLDPKKEKQIEGDIKNLGEEIKD